ncbi:uncharacterized protein LOC112341456 [Selaginella moellendorffii]|uniref:uncharacterized protein LOC112341456 n=1 Tax=Selaginella moellendorffii TaxID=88036 RepID=UPI000D1C2358|nr:uncharacterized protein LOC112341456 [Selaginella moellendorffii]|eukprot:XP_024517328.1 uncharacterized protein LOC112341456 [Selaginella moellendorffii]
MLTAMKFRSVCSSPPRENFTPSRGLGVRVSCARRRKSGALGVAVSAATALLRFLERRDFDAVSDSAVDDESSFQLEEVLARLKSDYDRSYFLTGDFTRSIYKEDCFFADPTIQFQGRDLYRRNLMLLSPFYESPSLVLLDIKPDPEVCESDQKAIVAFWRLRTYLKLPWRPLVTLDGSTKYKLDSSCRITSHVESWSISPLQALSQLFRSGL